MADKAKFSQKAMDAALSERDQEVSRLVEDLAARIADLEQRVGPMPAPCGEP